MRSEHRGIAMLEFAIILPAIVAIIALSIDCTLCLQERSVLIRAARAAARATVSETLQDPNLIVESAQDAARSYLAMSGRDVSQYTIAIFPQNDALTKTGNAPFHRIVVAKNPGTMVSVVSAIDAFQLCSAISVRSIWRVAVPSPTGDAIC